VPGILTAGGVSSLPGNEASKKAQAKYATFIAKVHGATGIDSRVLTAWTTIENGPAGNPLNIGPGRNYGDQAGAATATINLLRTSGSYAPILRAASQGDVNAQLQAIAVSPWDANHYRGDSQTVGASLRGVYAGLFGAAPGRGIPGAVSDVGGALAGSFEAPALRVGLYLLFTIMSLGLIALALSRLSSAAPGPAGYARGVPGRVADRANPARVFGF
jgi:hypothetical protein